MQTHDQAQRVNLPQLGTLTLLVGLGWCVLACYALHAAMPFNAIRLPFEPHLYLIRWAPEGWAFFTRSPREEDLYSVRRTAAGSWLPAADNPYSRPKNFFGLNRAPKAQGIELGFLLHQVDKKAWDQCETTPAQCLEDAPTAKIIRNASPDPTYCGTIGVIKQAPVPWAWSRSAARIQMPIHLVKLEVRCE